MPDNSRNLETSLEGWKEIAAYLQRDESTARRWEREEGLAVRRHEHKMRSGVYAYPSELDAWRTSRLSTTPGEQAEPQQSPIPRRLIPGLAVAGVIVLAFLVIRFGPVLNPPSPIAQAAADGLRTELVWPKALGASPQGSVSHDGKFVTYVDWWDEGNLAIRNLGTGENRRLTHTANGVSGGGAAGLSYASNSRISPDGKQVVYSWAHPSPAGANGELRLLPLDGDPTEPRTIWSPADSSWASVQDWFPGGDRVAAVVTTPDKTQQIVTVSLADGQVRQIRSVEWGKRPVVRVSPNGRYLAYSRTPSREITEKDIFLVAVDGQSESAIVKHAASDEVVAWSPDGGHLLFNSDRSGQPGLWAQQVDQGMAVGEPILIIPNLDVGSGMGVTRDGTLHYSVRVSLRRLKLAEIDMKTGKLLRQPINLIERFVGGNSRGVFSPDGDELAYLSERGRYPARQAVVIRSLATGEERDLPHRLSGIDRLSWHPDGQRLRVKGANQKGQPGFFGVDAATGETNTGGPRDRFIGGYSISLSPDGRQIATIHGHEIRLHPVEGGDGRVLWSTDERPRFGRWTVWTPDGKALLVLKRPANETELSTLWIVPVDGSPPIETELRHEPANAGAYPLDIHPDGRRVVYAAGGYFQQFWALHDLPFEQREQAAE